MLPDATLILTREQIQSLMKFPDYVPGVEEAFRLYAAGKSLSPGVLDVRAPDGTFHIKAAGLPLRDRIYVAVKVNGNFRENKSRFNLPTIQGAIILSDGTNGFPLAILDSTEITVQRTGAATTVAAKYLARSDSRTATVCGCGKQGRIQLAAILTVLPLQKVYAFDSNPQIAIEFASDMTKQTGIPISPTSILHDAAILSDVIVACTTSREFFLRKNDVRAGTFISAVGADSHDKQEIDPLLLSTNKVVADITDQSVVMGDVHHAIRQGLMKREDVFAELGEIVIGRKPRRSSAEEIIIFDSTGTAIQDVAAAATVYEIAIQKGAGQPCKLL
ncbi:MAG: hypothetical protein C5B54_12210 [Acidobacteria bacterium]|nr:MAG: hypothetical protein C5B54_12210 [Acidobacteriota bacterium]